LSKRDLKVEDLISQVRSLLDEDNGGVIKDLEDILPALNRAQDYAMDILARHYDESLLTSRDVTLKTGGKILSLPKKIFEERLERVELSKSGHGVFYELDRISLRDLSPKTSLRTYAIVGRKLRLTSSPPPGSIVRLWYLQPQEELVPSLARIDLLPSTPNEVFLKEISPELKNDFDPSLAFNQYVNVIKTQTGEVCGSLQIGSLSRERLVFANSPLRSMVLGRDITGDLASLPIEEGDYICSLRGSCCPRFKSPISNFIIQYAVADMRRKLGETTEADEKLLVKLEKQVKHSWVGREATLRVSKKNFRWR